jgi:hypothetical protein
LSINSPFNAHDFTLRLSAGVLRYKPPQQKGKYVVNVSMNAVHDNSTSAGGDRLSHSAASDQGTNNVNVVASKGGSFQSRPSRARLNPSIDDHHNSLINTVQTKLANIFQKGNKRIVHPIDSECGSIAPTLMIFICNVLGLFLVRDQNASICILLHFDCFHVCIRNKESSL